MAWPYQFLDLSEADKHVRRQLLDRYAIYAQLSVLVPVALVLILRVASWAAASRKPTSYSAVPSSPSIKARRESKTKQHSSSAGWASRARKVQWWLGEDVVLFDTIAGQRDQWVFGFSYLFWMLLLCVLDTRRDYLHLTKRLGIIAASQYPAQYLLSLKSLNPFAYLLRSSHEHINRWHRVLARITTTLLSIHALLYLNFFVQAGIFAKRMLAPVVVLGVVAFLLLNLMYTTALRPIRQYSYRLFFVAHVLIAFALPPLVFFHAHPARSFMVEAVVVLVADLVSRKMGTVTAQATVEAVVNTDLVKIRIAVPKAKAENFRARPGSHVYLAIPPAARKSLSPKMMFEFLFNPFTVAHVDDRSGDLTLVARRLSGPMTAALAQLAADSSSGGAGKVPLCIEGPYGIARHFPPLSSGSFDRVLLVAGGIGATFIVPLFRSILEEDPRAQVEMVWAVRGHGETSWVSWVDERTVGDDGLRSVVRPEGLSVFVTGGGMGDITSSQGTGTGSEEGSQQQQQQQNQNPARPDLKSIVDRTFKHGSEERVAVIVCGPEGMSRELRRYVGVWVMKGRTVWWHNEGFGF
ncbi:ferric reductase NAD binding domain-containing protein [Bombardia bombarda]|uniref:ferric-chelate reductase (NADPH) n=1 Tax=Bombardia bombarda TaxID=252184 RepID=A0AA39X0Y9_9PEZI|nr:ferric reductase NAD binding domain-containing protein [Bombardia bombarda]